MLVTRVAEPESYAVVGGGMQRAAQVAASAAAFRTMTDTLYRNKLRAVAREVICNALDAHTDSGCDKPVEITLTASEFKVRDYGRGIPDEKMVEIYFTLFGSTKEMNSKMIGGFGLGAKSPFAISDHFVVTSHHNGMRHTYLMHTGDAESKGIPGLRVMSKGPTTESGVEVSVPHSKEAELRKEIAYVVESGGIKATLNGVTLVTRDYAPLVKEEIGLYKSVGDGWRYSNSLKVLIGNVIYPVDHHASFDKEIKKLLEHSHGREIIVRAKPSTISMAPSRESLSYDDETLAELRRLLRRVSKSVQKNMLIAREEVYADIRKHVRSWKEMVDHEFLESLIPSTNDDRTAIIGAYDIGAITGKASAVQHFQHHDWGKTLSHVRDYRRFFRSLAKRNKSSYYGSYSLMIARMKHYRLTKALMRAGLMDQALVRGDRGYKPFEKTSAKSIGTYKIRVVTAQFREQINRQTYLDHEKSPRESFFDVCFVDRKMTQETKDFLTKHFEKFNIEVRHLKPIERVDAPKKVRVKKDPAAPVEEKLREYYPMLPNISDIYGCIALGTRASMKPSAFYSADKMQSRGYHAIRSNAHSLIRTSALKTIAKAGYFEGLVGIGGVKDRDTALKAGVPRIEAVLLEKVRARLKTPLPFDTEYSSAVTELVSRDSIADLSEKALSNRHWMDLMYDFESKPDEDAARDEAFGFWVSAFFFLTNKHRNYSSWHLDILEYEEWKTATTEFAELMKDRQAKKPDFTEKWAQMKVAFNSVVTAYTPFKIEKNTEFVRELLALCHKHKETLNG